MLTKQHLQFLGDTVVMTQPGPYVSLPSVEPTKRTFPIEHKTITPKFNDMRPNPGVKINETPKKDNSYQNGYPKTESILDVRYKEGTVNNWFYPDIDFKRH